MNTKIKKSQLRDGFVAIILWLFAGLSTLINQTFINSSIQSLLLLCCIGIAGISCLRKQVWGNNCILLILMYGISMIHCNRSRVDFLLYTLMFILLALASFWGWSQALIKVLYATYVGYALATIAFLFLPGIYLNNIVTLFPETSQRLVKWYNSGYMAGLANHYSTNAMFICSGLMIAAGNYLYKKSRKNGLMVIVFIVALLLTGKRGPLIFAAGALFALYYFSIPKEKGATRFIKTIGLIIGAACIFVVVISVIPSLSGVVSRFQETVSGGDISMGRYTLWSLAIDQFKVHPIIGIGWGRFYLDVSLAYNGITRYHVHNTYLQLLCETGVVGFSLYIVWFWNSLSKSIKVFRYQVRDGKDYSQIAFSVAFQIFFLLYCFTGNNLYEDEMYIPYFLSCAIMYWQSRI